MEQKAAYFPIPAPRLAVHLSWERLSGSSRVVIISLQCMSVRPERMRRAGPKAETAGSPTSLSGPGRYPDRKQLDAPLNRGADKHLAWKRKSCSSKKGPPAMDFSPRETQYLCGQGIFPHKRVRVHGRGGGVSCIAKCIELATPPKKTNKPTKKWVKNFKAPDFNPICRWAFQLDVFSLAVVKIGFPAVHNKDMSEK